MMTQSEYDALYKWVEDYINTKCIVRKRGMPGKIPGTQYSWMFYLRNGLFNHEFSSAVAQMFVYKIHNEVGHFNFQLAGLETGSTPLLSSIPLVARIFGLSLNSFSIRKEQKTYGLQNWIEGIPNDLPVMIVDDLCNSSTSMKRSYDILKSHNLPVLDDVFCIVNKVNKHIHDEQRQHTDMYLPSDMKVHYLFDLDNFNLSNPSH